MVTKVRLRGRWEVDGRPATGTISVCPSVPVVDTDGHVITPVTPVTRALTAGELPELWVVASDSTGLLATGFSYSLVERVHGTTRVWSSLITAAAATVVDGDLSVWVTDLVPHDPITPTQVDVLTAAVATAQGGLAAHAAATTDVHGIADTSALLTTSSIGTSAGTVAAGNDSRITGAAQRAGDTYSGSHDFAAAAVSMPDPTADEHPVVLGQSGTTLGVPTVSDGAVAVAVRSVWGITAAGVPYYDPAGAATGEEAVMGVDATTGALTLTRIGG